MKMRVLGLIALVALALGGAGVFFLSNTGQPGATAGCGSCDIRHQNLRRLTGPAGPDTEKAPQFDP